MTIKQKAAQARSASMILGGTSEEIKNRGLSYIADGLKKREEEIFAANARDLANASENSVPSPLVKRLKFDGAKLEETIEGIRSLITIPDPVGKTLDARELDRGLELYRVASPIGVIGIIFESRPDALVQISTLCLKSGNAVMLKGGSEALETNKILYEIIKDSAYSAGLPEGWIQLLETRDDVRGMLDLDRDIDLIIPRGSNEFVKYIMDNTNIPVLGHADGICHAYIHDDINSDSAIAEATAVVVDSKTQYVAVCNALETLLVHKDGAEAFLPAVHDALKAKGVTLRGCENTRKIIDVEPANEADWSTEYLELILSVKVVGSLDEAIDHINSYGSHHTDSILTKSRDTAEQFMKRVDSANVMWNCSTRFADGYRYGLGAEVGIGTGKIHARGPVGMEGLLIYKWKLFGDGHVVADYTGPGAKSFTHKSIGGR